jgi:mRNA interferase RelE/StbE
MPYTITFTKNGTADLQAMPNHLQKRIIKKLSFFGDLDSLQPHLKKLAGSDFSRLRIGDYRIIITLHEELLIVHFIEHRKDVYRK